MARTFKEFLDVFIHGETLEEQRRKDARKRGNIISGEIAPRNVISGRIADRPAATISPEEMAEMDRVAAGVGPTSIKPPPGRGLEPRFRPPTGRQPLLPEFPITPEGDVGARVPEVLPDTGTATGTAPGPGFDWARFIEVAGTMGAALAPQGAFAKAGLAAAGLVRGERERGVKAATAEEDKLRFGVEVALKEVDDALNQAQLDWQKDPSNPRSMENLIRLQQEKANLTRELQTQKDVAAGERAKVAAGAKAKKQKAVTLKDRRTIKNKAMKALNDLDTLITLGLQQSEVPRLREIISGMEITGEEGPQQILDEAIRVLRDEVSAEDLFGEAPESGLEVDTGREDVLQPRRRR